MLTQWQWMLLFGSQLLLSAVTLIAVLITLSRNKSRLKCSISYRIEDNQITNRMLEFEAVNMKYIPVHFESCGIFLPQRFGEKLTRKPLKKLLLTELSEQLEQKILLIDEKMTLELNEAILQKHLTHLGLTGSQRLLFYFKDTKGYYYKIPFKLKLQPDQKSEKKTSSVS
ncbi:hypothetical protein SAMN05444392_12110 [Seinonella peptonophila]|uniref:Uncharacterized protein n=1 Tax=Seinonella peptonophila TaxID=112248 RepID=A0A1M5BCP3_9BACL|nr:hypothetical protein [Seinonella peptonophila]SHF40146.1 hypothetical protein SAMN05444392_12110 [Seinonella peptonophila]